MCIPFWISRSCIASLVLLTWSHVLKLDASSTVDLNTVQTMVAGGKIAELKALGREVLPVMARLYDASDVTQRTRIAQTFYALGWKSPDAKRVLIKDVHTPNQQLRLEVQWALGRVSNEDDVVAVLLNNMQHDANPLFRDKAACALASDQIHLTEQQKVRLFAGLIQALGDSKPDVRRIAMLALQIQTGQTKGFNPDAPVAERDAKIREWKQWLEEYKSNL
jgi:HEAT repeat protein